MLELALFADRHSPVRHVEFDQEASWSVKESPPPAVFVVDGRGRVVKANASALRVLGRASEEIIGQHYWRFLSVFRSGARLDGKGSFSDPILRSLATEEPQLSIMGLLHRRGGISEPFDGAIAPVYEGVSGPRGAVIIAELGTASAV
jgi:PAS domain-containing protein